MPSEEHLASLQSWVMICTHRCNAESERKERKEKMQKSLDEVINATPSTEVITVQKDCSTNHCLSLID